MVEALPYTERTLDTVSADVALVNNFNPLARAVAQ